MKQILVVGSDPKISSDLDRYLDRKEFKLMVCPQSKSLITSMMNAQPDLVIFDLNSIDSSALEMIKKTKELDSNLPLIVLSDNQSGQTKDQIWDERIYGWITPPVQIEKLASIIKQALSSKRIGPEQKVLAGSAGFTSQEKNHIEAKKDMVKSYSNPSPAKPDYHHLFEELLGPIFEQIMRDCRGQVYDQLLSGLEKTMISEMLKQVNHNQVKASQVLGISRNTLRERMKRFDIF